MSKGSNARPFEVPREQFEKNWDEIFRKTDQAQQAEEEKSKDDAPNKDTK